MPASSLKIGPKTKMISYSKIFNSRNIRNDVRVIRVALPLTLPPCGNGKRGISANA
jgi:hypothetical protein